MLKIFRPEILLPRQTHAGVDRARAVCYGVVIMAHIDTTIHPLYIQSLSRDVSPAIQTQLKRYCHKFEYDESRTYTATGIERRYKVRLYGLRENCRLLVHMLVEPYV